MKTLATGSRALRLTQAAYHTRRMRRATSEEARQLARARLVAVLGEARGLPMKFGQLLAGANPDDPLAPLLHGVQPLAWSTVRPALEAALGPVERHFEWVDPVGQAASLGQVHHARMHDGKEVAIKVRYPEIVDAVDAELSLAGLMPSMGPVKRWGFDLEAYKRSLRDNMRRELDYTDEARRQRDFAASVRVSGLVVPHVMDELARDSVLVQSWEPGAPLHEAFAWPLKHRLHCARILLETLFVSTFSAGTVHGDPHMGNYRVRRKDDQVRVVLHDYGCTVEIGSTARLALLQLLVRLRRGGRVQPLHALAACGFDAQKLEPIEDALTPLCEALFAPLLVDHAFDTRSWHLSRTVDAHLGDLKWWFRSAGPPSLLLLIRAFAGVLEKLRLLQVQLPWWPVLQHALGQDLLERADETQLPQPAGLQRPATEVACNGWRARLLRVHVARAEHNDLRLAVPAREALELERVVPWDVRRQLAAQGVDLRALSERARASGLSPQVLCERRLGNDQVRVWLE